MCCRLVQQRAPLTCITQGHWHQRWRIIFCGIDGYSDEFSVSQHSVFTFLSSQKMFHVCESRLSTSLTLNWSFTPLVQEVSVWGFKRLIPLKAVLWSSSGGCSRRSSAPTNSRNVTWISNSRGINAQLEKKKKARLALMVPVTKVTWIPSCSHIWCYWGVKPLWKKSSS